ncbi:MAG: glycoside hydrolase family 3 C-terminal domain-containing protein [Limisphaerales bacterium]
MKTRPILKTSSLTLLGLSFCLASIISVRAADVNFRQQADVAIKAIGTEDPAAMKVPEVSVPEIWKDPSQPVDARVHDLVSRMTLAEKISQLDADAPAIPRLGIPAYSYRNEALHGVADDGVATVFPEPIGMAATWDVPLIHKEAEVIAIEGRAKFNDYISKHNGNSTTHRGITFYAPNLNLVRDPRWGRGQETYGEDPFLISQFGVAFIRGLQGNDPKYIETLACAKHYAVHDGPEPLRHIFNATPSQRDLYDTYLPAFEAAVREGHVGSIMGAYSSLYGVPDCANPFLLTQLPRQWNFDGYIVSDGGAICDIWQTHKYVATPEEAAAVAVKAGCDLFSGAHILVPGSGRHQSRGDFDALGLVLQKHLLSEKQIDAAVCRTYAARFRLGFFDPPAMVPWSKIGIDQNDTPEHRALALKVAEESIVLLKNSHGFLRAPLLPLGRKKIKRIAVIGANGDSASMLLGNYHGQPSRSTTILDGIKELAGPNIEVSYAQGCPLALKKDGSNKPSPKMTAQAVALAKSADVVIFVSGIDSSLEKEGTSKVKFQGFLGGDRTKIELPSPQEELLKKLYATGKPIVFVNCSGSAMAMPWEAEHLPAIIQAWYPGEEGGRAVAEVLFGDVNPAGRLPVTFYRSTKDLPSFEDYSMSNRTYRYFNGKPLFAFGHGLSYTKFDYANVKLNAATFNLNDPIKLSFTLKNTGNCDGDEVAQVYFRHLHSAMPQPKESLCGFTRIHLTKGESRTITLEIPTERFRCWSTTQKKYVVEPGKYELLVGAASDDIRLRAPVEIAAEP